jgi:hypothetical protein
VQPKNPRQPDPRASERTMTKQELQHDHPRNRPWTSTRAATMHATAEIRQDGHQITRTVRHAATPHLKPCGTTLNHLPLVYKRRRRPPSRGDDPHTTDRTLSLTILAFASSNPQGLGGFSSSPAFLVAPLYKHHGALQYNAMSAPLLDVCPRPEPG